MLALILVCLLRYHTEIPKVEYRWISVGEDVSEYRLVALPPPEPEWKQRLRKDFQEQTDREELQALLHEAKIRNREEAIRYRQTHPPKK